MKLAIAFIVGAAIGLAAAMMMGGRDSAVEMATWAGDDRTPPPMPQDDGMAGAPA